MYANVLQEIKLRIMDLCEFGAGTSTGGRVYMN